MTAGGVILAYAPIIDTWERTTPTVSMRTTPKGDLEPFLVQNNSSLFSLVNYTPDCRLDFAMWNTPSGNMTMKYISQESPLTNARLPPGEADNFVCDVNSQWRDFGIAHRRNIGTSGIDRTQSKDTHSIRNQNRPLYTPSRLLLTALLRNSNCRWIPMDYWRHDCV